MNKTVKMNCTNPTKTMVSGWQEVTPLISKKNPKHKRVNGYWSSYTTGGPRNFLTETTDLSKATKVRVVNKYGTKVVVSIDKFEVR